MFNRHHAGERGQSLILVALAGVALFAFAALAIDGGMLYGARRIAQNAADGGSVSGTYRLYEARELQAIGGDTVQMQQDEILAEVRKTAEAHDVPSVGENVHAYFTDEEGNLLPSSDNPCRMPNCDSRVNWNAWGVFVEVDNPIDTFFAGVIGWNVMKANADAVAVIHAATRAADDEYWAVFALDGSSCNRNYPTSLRGADMYIIGNVHSNTSINVQARNSKDDGVENPEEDWYVEPGEGRGLYIRGDLTYVDECSNCYKYEADISGDIRQVDPIGLTVPSYGEYTAVAEQKVEEQGVKQCSGNQVYGGVCEGNFNIDGGQVGSEQYPYTYINGNLDIGSNTRLHGLIVVTGEVRINGDNNHGTFTVVSGSTTKIQGKDNFMDPGWDQGGFCQQPYEAMYNKPFRDPNVTVLKENGIRFFSNAYSGACTGALSVSGSRNYMTGSLVAPNDGLDWSGSMNLLCGNLIGDWIDVSGARSYIYYRRDFFPPQPDLIELLQ